MRTYSRIRNCKLGEASVGHTRRDRITLVTTCCALLVAALVIQPKTTLGQDMVTFVAADGIVHSMNASAGCDDGDGIENALEVNGFT